MGKCQAPHSRAMTNGHGWGGSRSWARKQRAFELVTHCERALPHDVFPRRQKNVIARECGLPWRAWSMAREVCGANCVANSAPCPPGWPAFAGHDTFWKWEKTKHRVPGR